MSLAVAALAAWAAAAAAADAPGSTAVTVTAVPPSLELCPGESRQVQVVIRNDGRAAVRNVRFASFTTAVDPAAAALALAPAGGSPLRADRLEPGGALLGTLTVTARDALATSAVAHLRAEYEATGTAPARSASLAALEVKRPAAPAADAVKAEVKASSSVLHEGDMAALTLLVTNGSASPLRVRGIRASAAPATRLTPQGAPPDVLPPQQATAVAYHLAADHRIVPGRYLGWFDVETEGRAGCGATHHLLATFETTLGVTGESELLKLVDVPSLLFLPGFLVLSVGMLMWRVKPLRWRYLASSEAFPIGFKDPEFWLLGVTLSLALTAAAPGIAIVGQRRAYGLGDIMWLWTISLGAGALLALLALTADRAGLRLSARRRARRELRPEDDPHAALAKMALRGWQVRQAPPVEVRGANPPIRGHRLWGREDGGGAWVLPPIRCVRLGEAFDDGILDGEDVGQLSQALDDAEAKGLCHLEWEPAETSGLAGPTAFPPGELVPRAGANLIALVARERGE